MIYEERVDRTMATQPIEVPADQIRDFCHRNHIRRLALFGSVPRGDAHAESDLDVLVEFEPGHMPGLAFIRMRDELSSLFGGYPVDLVPQRSHPATRASRSCGAV